ncbi:FecR family protein [Sunxiuqinia sp. A32]|uniref:FecR family protein n=1 Tax=Sunxiuqinia sp. A32 TaxID=3461496 RepID=UPI004045F18A
MKDQLLAKILNGEATEEERAEFYNSLENRREDQERFYEIKSLWVKSAVGKENSSSPAELEELLRKIDYKKRRKELRIINNIAKIAAVFVLIFSLGGLAGYFIFHSSQQEFGIQKYTALKGSVSVVEFPDGTRVWLNSGSEITYQEDRFRNQRKVDLRGEAYFDVVHNEKMPFVVNTGKLVVYDLGTTFNVKAYENDNYIETSLVEGKAEIQAPNGKKLLSLNPGESAYYQKSNNQLEVRQIAANVISAWRDGKFVIRDQRLEDIFIELSRWYNVEFTFETQRYKDFRFTGTIKKSTTAQHVLKMLKVTTDFNYRIIEKSVGPDEIIIY